MEVFGLLIASCSSLKLFRTSAQKKCDCGNASALYSDEILKYDNRSLNFQNFSYEDQGFIGKGYYSVVRKSILEDGRSVAIKKINEMKDIDIRREISILRALENVNGTVKLVGVSGNEESPSILYSYHESKPYNNLSIEEFKFWMKRVLIILADMHAAGVIHRDLRLSNILADLPHRSVTIIDFGLSDFNRPGVPKNPNIGCIRIKAPELALGSKEYDCSIDMWGLGLTCLDIMVGMRGNWDPRNNSELIGLLQRHFGTKEWNRVAEVYNRSLVSDRSSSGDIFELAMPGYSHLVTKESVDLVARMLRLNPAERISARDALGHPFLSGIEA